MIRVCFVCMGNICRSPTAQGVMQRLVDRAGLAQRFQIESAGTGGWHAGELPDRRTRTAAQNRGLELSSRARQFARADFARFDYVIAMDGDNLEQLGALAPSAEARAKLTLLRAFDGAAPAGAGVPDPYYGGPEGFEEVLDICERACGQLLAHLRDKHRL